MGSVSVYYKYETIAQAIIMTIMLVGGITLFIHFKHKTDSKNFDVSAPIIPMYCVALVAYVIMSLVFDTDFYKRLLAICSVITFGLFLLIDIATMMGGNQVGFTYDSDSDIQATASIFTDIIVIFISMIAIMNEW